MSSYEKLLEIKNKYRYDYFIMALSHFFDLGYQVAKQMPEEEIENAEANGLMTKDCVQWIMRTAKEIANCVDSAVEVVQFCNAEDIYDVRYYANKLPRWRMEEMLQSRISQENNDTTKEEELEELTFLYDCDAEDFELLGFDIPEDMR